MRPRRLALILSLAFLLGGGSAGVAVQTKRAIDRARAEHDVGSVGHLIELTLWSPEGEIIASPRLIAPRGKSGKLLLMDPSDPERIRLALRFEAARQLDGDVALDYELKLPSHALDANGTLSLTPGVDKEVPLENSSLQARIFVLPVPSPAFDAYLESRGYLPDPRDSI